MTQEQKDLLLKDLCARLPYGVVIQEKCVEQDKTFLPNKEGDRLVNIDAHADLLMTNCGSWYYLDEIKPYLFPLSSMTNELWDKEFMGCGITEFTRDSFKYGCETLDFSRSNPNLSSMVRFINQLIKNHFDIYGLIEKGLAIDATGLNIY